MEMKHHYGSLAWEITTANWSTLMVLVTRLRFPARRTLAIACGTRLIDHIMLLGHAWQMDRRWLAFSLVCSSASQENGFGICISFLDGVTQRLVKVDNWTAAVVDLNSARPLLSVYFTALLGEREERNV